MCGLCGILQLPGGPPVDPALLDHMRDEIAHRGPDAAGSWVSADGKVGLGSRRLAIIDLSPAGHMPMTNASGTVHMAFNGEVYNYTDHRPALTEAGYPFRSHTDTEVVLALYDSHGADFVQHLRGMFALALYDEARQELHLVRDRIGIKPLYYTLAGGQLIFGSEIKCLLQHPAVHRAVDEEALYHYLTFLTTPPPRTLFKGIHKLPAAHHAIIGADGELRIHEYWDTFDDAVHQPGWGADDWVAAIRSELRESIRLRMVSDVPFGVFLSGGIDSSTNTALMAEQLDHPVRSFSIGYHNAPAYNEYDWARQVAAHFATDHHEIQIGERELLDFLPRLIYHQDEPIADPVCVPIYYVSKLARDSGTIVVQVGEGADELFGGYDHWTQLLRFHAGPWLTFGRVPAPLRRLTAAALGPAFSPVRRELLRRGAAAETMFWSGAEAFGESAKPGLLAPDYARRMAGLSSHDIIAPFAARFAARSPQPDLLNWMGYIDLHLRLPELLLMRVDKMSMATSIEARVPYLDHKFVGLAMSIPQALKVDGQHARAKHLFKRAVRGIIPDTVIDRPKQGFQVPVKDWMYTTLGDFGRRKLRAFSERVGYLRWPAIERLIGADNDLAWYLLNFVLWHELWIENTPLDRLLDG